MPYFPRTTDRRSLELVRSKADRIASRREFERSLVYPDQFLPVPLRLPHAPTSQTTKRKSIVVPSEAEPGRRIILLSGERRIPRGAFHLEATIFASPKGHASGEILWTNVDSPGVPVDMACPELVRGTADGIYLELAGYHIEPPLISESYRITLYGAEEVGVFQGICCLCGVWDAPLSGTYQIVTAHE